MFSRMTRELFDKHKQYTHRANDLSAQASLTARAETYSSVGGGHAGGGGGGMLRRRCATNMYTGLWCGSSAGSGPCRASHTHVPCSQPDAAAARSHCPALRTNCLCDREGRSTSLDLLSVAGPRPRCVLSHLICNRVSRLSSGHGAAQRRLRSGTATWQCTS